MRDIAIIPLLAFDAVVNVSMCPQRNPPYELTDQQVYLTSLFLAPLWSKLNRSIMEFRQVQLEQDSTRSATVAPLRCERWLCGLSWDPVSP
jgi:hypothetical protein